jgi:NAD(P)-dependent dehydrogenase (short-subunit alcohol dehydrogenase family)
MDLSGKTALVTGASRGIGRAVAQALLAEGMNVTLTSRNAHDVERVADELGAAGGGRALGVACDVRQFDALERAVTATLEAFGSLDAVVANAGIGAFAPIDTLSLDAWHATIDTNLTGVFHTVKASVEALKRSQGTIITIGSLAGANFFAGGAAYNASKFGLTGFSQAIMLDLRKHGIKVSTIMPGSVATHFSGNAPGPDEAWKIQPEDLAEMVLYLLRTPQRTLPSKIEVRPSRPPGS